MGYTHYWDTSAPFTEEQWAIIKTAARKALKLGMRDGIFVNSLSSGKLVASEAGLDEVFAYPGIIQFGGDCEDFVLERLETGFNFCKTRRGMYDPMVVAVLHIAHKAAPESFKPSSDGRDEDLAEGLKYAEKAYLKA